MADYWFSGIELTMSLQFLIVNGVLEQNKLIEKFKHFKKVSQKN